MNCVAILDTSCLLWDINDYNNNSFEYLNLKTKLINLFQVFSIERPYVLLRGELIEEIISSFPFDQLSPHFHDYIDEIFRFLINTSNEQIITCPATKNTISSNPIVVKDHFSNVAKNEVCYILNFIHQAATDDNCYFAHRYLYLSNAQLVTTRKNNDVTCTTVFFDDEGVLSDYFEQFKKVFEANPVHHSQNKRGSKKSRLRCYNGRDTTIPQDYLNRSIFENNRHYFYDPVNEVYVVFLRHEKNRYHGHEEENLNKIPEHVKNHFNVR